MIRNWFGWIWIVLIVGAFGTAEFLQIRIIDHPTSDCLRWSGYPGRQVCEEEWIIHHYQKGHERWAEIKWPQ